MRVMITGGSRGIGRGIADELAKSGHDLLLVSRIEDRLAKTASTLKGIYNSQVLYKTCDVSSEKNIEQLLAYCYEVKFLPDVLVLNAGIFIEGSLVDSESQDFHQTMQVDLFQIYYCVKHFIKTLKHSSNGKVIIIGSTASLEPYPAGALYGVAKWALKGYAVNLRKELMPHNIAVTLLNPGGTLTDLWDGEELLPDRLLEPSDIGKLVSAIITLSPQAVVEEVIVRPMLGDIHD